MTHASKFFQMEKSNLLGDYGTPPKDSDNPSLEERPPSSNLWVYGVLILVLLAGGFYYWEGFGTKNPGLETVHKQLEALKAGQLTQAYHDYNSQELKQSISLAAFRQFILQYPLLMSYETVKLVPKGSVNASGEVLINARISSPKQAELSLDYTLVLEGEEWKIWSMQQAEDPYTDQGLITQGQGDKEERDPAFQPIATQLKAIQSGNLSQAYYGVVSKQFEHSTPLADFKTFIESHPFLKQFRGLDIVDRKVGEDRAEIRVLLQSPSQSLSIEYTLALEKGQWKIWGMRFIQPNEKQKLRQEQALLQPIEDYLDAIREQDLPRAYYTITTKGFRSQTSLKEFYQFIKDFPELTQGYFKLVKKSVDETRGFVLANFVAPTSTLTLKFLLVQENQEWHILGIEVVEMQKQPPHESPIKTAKLQPKRAGAVIAEASTPSSNKMMEPLPVEERLKQTIREMLSLLRKEDWQTAYRDYTSAEFKEATNSQEFYKFVSHYTVFKGTKTISFEELTFDNNVALYKVKLIAENGSATLVQFDLTKEEGKWKILQIQVFAYQKGSV